VVTDISTEGEDFILVDMDREGQQLIAATGGKGGKGNVHFASSTNQAPRLATKGLPGQEKRLMLELKLIADVGIIGLPNAGKSSLLAAVSAARPRVASYPFTTLEPELGTVCRQKTAFVVADIPGIIEGASRGKGLGYQFLRHIVRTRLLLHLVDGLSPDPVTDFNIINQELALYDPELAGKNQVVAVSKIDLAEVVEARNAIAQKFAALGKEARFISALTGQGTEELVEEIADRLERLPAVKPAVKVGQAVKIFRPEPARRGLEIQKNADGFTICDPELERVAAGSDTSDSEVRRQLWKLLERKHGVKSLEKAGIQPGDRVKLGSFEWRW
jgi:GTP-binding protein